jgi:hypothetical protein
LLPRDTGLRREAPCAPLGGGRPFRSAATCEPRDPDHTKTGPPAIPSGVGDEYAISDRPSPPPNSRLTGDRQTLTDAVIVRACRRAGLATRRTGAPSGTAVRRPHSKGRLERTGADEVNVIQKRALHTS